MGEERDYLGALSSLDGPEATLGLYDAWAETYDATMERVSYAAPMRAARALAAHAADPSAPLLDIGCGTGISGQAFRDYGFRCIDGLDFSELMLAKARAKAGLYRTLIRADLNQPFPFAPGSYANIAAVGVLRPHHGPPDLIDRVLAVLPPGGCFVFSFTDIVARDPGYVGRLRENLDSGRATLLFKEYGAHLPTEDLQADIYVLGRV